MTNKFPLWCPTCLDRPLSPIDQPCASCGFSPGWYQDWPNMYRKDPDAKEPEVQAVKPEPEPDLTMVTSASTATSTDIVKVFEELPDELDEAEIEGEKDDEDLPDVDPDAEADPDLI